VITRGLASAAPAPITAPASPTLPPISLAPAPGTGLEARSVSTRSIGTEQYSTIPKSFPLMGLRSQGTIRDAHRATQAAQSKADAPPGRVSRADPSQYEEALLGQYATPPFDLDRLTDMLYESDTYDSIIRQFALDACSGWSLIDAAEGAPDTSPGNPSTGDDTAAKEQRLIAERMLDRMTYDFDAQHVSLTTFSQFLVKDRKATGNAHNEIVRDEQGKPAQLIHIPSRLIRRGLDGRTFLQLDEMGRPAAFFRRFGAEIQPIDPTILQSETPWAYVSREEAMTIQGAFGPGELPGPGQRVGDLKRELTDFKIYHPRERYYGIPPIVSAFNSLVGNIFASNRNVRFFVNRGMPDWLVMIKASSAAFSDPDTRENIIDRIQNTIEEHMKYMIEGEDHRTLTLRVPIDGYDVVFEKLGGEPSDQEWSGYQIANRDNIIHVYGMQPSKLGINETASLGTGSGESQDETYKRSQIDPEQAVLEAFFDLMLDELGFMAVDFKYDEIDILDEQREVSMLVGVASTGALSINDIRAWASMIVKHLDFPPDDSEEATIPIRLLDLQTAGLLARAGGDAGSAMALPGQRSGTLSRIAGMFGLGGGDSRQSPEDALTRLRQGTTRVSDRVASRRPELPAGNGGGS